MTVAETLADMVITTRTASLPDRAMDLAAMIVASTIASAAAGRGIASAKIVRDLELERGGRPEASVWFETRAKLPVVGAARANALMSDAAASDDSDLRNIVHAGTPLTATSLAIAERVGSSGVDMLAAIVVGYEAAGRIGESIIPRFDHRGFHGCLGAAFGAAAAAARLLGLDTNQAAHAIVLTATSVGGLAKAAATSVSREYHAGSVTVAGIEAALAAKHGFTGELELLEMDRGFCQMYGGPEANVDAITRDLGRDWDIATDMAIKLVPGGHPYHAFGEAAANAAREGDIAPEDIEAIVIARPGMTKVPGPFHPSDLIAMAHSPAYFAAAGAHDRQFGWEHATPAKIGDPRIHALIGKVQIGPQPTENAGQYRQGATVTIATTGGRSVTNTVLVPKGAAMLGVGWDDVAAKYRTLAPLAPMSVQTVETSLKAIKELRSAPQVAALLSAIC